MVVSTTAPGDPVMLAPPAEMAGDDIELGRGPAQDLGGLAGHVAVGRAVEAVAADAELAVKGVGQAVDVGLGRDRLVEGRVEDADLGDPGQELFAGLDAFEVMGVVQGGELDASVDRRPDLVRDQDRFRKVFAAVNDAVPDAADLAFLLDDAVMGAEEQVQDHLDGDAVVEDLAISRILFRPSGW
jgi:hypothetical protein